MSFNSSKTKLIQIPRLLMYHSHVHYRFEVDLGSLQIFYSPSSKVLYEDHTTIILSTKTKRDIHKRILERKLCIE